MEESGMCRRTLLDLLCYEVLRGTISLEMKRLFEDHLVKCPHCRSMAHDLYDLLSLSPQSPHTTIN